MKIFDILNEQDSEENKNTGGGWTKSEMGLMKNLIKKGFNEYDPTEIRNFLKNLGYESEETIDLYYLFKNNIVNDEFDFTEEPDRERHWEDFDSKQIALAVWLDLDPSEIEEENYSHYGLNNYNTPDGVYAIGTETEADDAAKEAAESLVKDAGVNKDFARHYITMSDTDRRIYAQEEADQIIDDMSDEDIINEKDLEDQMDEIDNEEIENRERIDELQTEIEDLESELEDLDANDDSERIEEINKLVLNLESQKEGLENIDYDERKEEIIDDAREELREEKYDQIYDELDDPVEYFVESRGIYSIEDLIDHGPIFLDEDEMVEDMVSEDGRGHYISSYDGDEQEQEYDGVTYYIYRTN